MKKSVRGKKKKSKRGKWKKKNNNNDFTGVHGPICVRTPTEFTGVHDISHSQQENNDYKKQDNKQQQQKEEEDKPKSDRSWWVYPEAKQFPEEAHDDTIQQQLSGVFPSAMNDNNNE